MNTPLPTSAAHDAVRESFGRLVYTHKTHLKEADRLAWHAGFWKWSEVALLALTTGSTISVLLGAGQGAQIASALLASTALFVTVAQLKFNPEQLLLAHRACANKLWLLREKYINLIADMKDGAVAPDEARKVRDELAVTVSQIYETAPPTNAKSYLTAQKALKEAEEMTFSDTEIDKFLPASLRKGN